MLPISHQVSHLAADDRFPSGAYELESFQFEAILRQNGLRITDRQREQFRLYALQLLKWNKSVNLISRKDENNIWQKHLLHCSSLLFHLSLLPGSALLDLGTGGGLPGIPLKILLPSLQVVLIDSVRKKTVATASMIKDLALRNIKVESGRAEELARRDEYRYRFDYVVARAVGELKDLVRWSSGFLRSRGPAVPKDVDTTKRMIQPPALIAMKGGDLEAEVREAKRDRRVKQIEVVELTIRGVNEMISPEKKAVIVFM